MTSPPDGGASWILFAQNLGQLICPICDLTSHTRDAPCKMFSTLLLAFLAINVVLASPLALQAREDTRSRVAYVLGNKPEGNVVLSLAIDSDDGRLSSPVQTSTGGKGLIGLTNGQSNLMDSLFSQGAVAVSQDVSTSFVA